MMESIGAKIKTWIFRCGSAIQNEKDDEQRTTLIQTTVELETYACILCVCVG